ncbi:MAG: hypothetical protein BWY75_01676 [bacterium ADurb.Bin425]|nr:MAG: hypothetical protein BWY75_01676 [bacterium ADurb.Bin425]
MPVKTLRFIPFNPLPKLTAHKEQFLTRCGVLIAEQQSQISELLPGIAGHLVEKRTFTMHHFIMRKRQNKVLGSSIHGSESQFVVIELAINGIQRKILERIIHPTHVPFQTKTKTA